LKRREVLQFGAGGLAAAFLPRSAGAQASYPERSIKLIVPRPAGGVVDLIAREWSGKVSKSLGANYIENMGGGGGTIGAAAAARAPADGYTLLFGTNSELVIRSRRSNRSPFFAIRRRRLSFIRACRRPISASSSLTQSRTRTA
jgi:tripartite-type tricarboxylate transporter receptor subunit TctC